MAILMTISRSPGDPLYDAIDFSLQKNAVSGIQDQLPGGFYRYSVNEKWMR
jgi:uncharacterized protein YyaL (SSP411 family)